MIGGTLYVWLHPVVEMKKYEKYFVSCQHDFRFLIRAGSRSILTIINIIGTLSIRLCGRPNAACAAYNGSNINIGDISGILY